jgi:hypothetical protein
MAVGYNPSIVSDGLVYFIDPANLRSYSGSGVTVNGLMSGLGATLPGLSAAPGLVPMSASTKGARAGIGIPKPPGASSFDPLDGNFCFKGFELRGACDEFCAPLFC